MALPGRREPSRAALQPHALGWRWQEDTGTACPSPANSCTKGTWNFKGFSSHGLASQYQFVTELAAVQLAEMNMLSALTCTQGSSHSTPAPQLISFPHGPVPLAAWKLLLGMGTPSYTLALSSCPSLFMNKYTK